MRNWEWVKLRITMWYDEENEDYVICDEDTVIDKENHTIRYTTDHFSTWMPVNKKTWYNVWRNEVNYYKTERQKPYCDIVFAVDVSGSMAGTEMQNARKAMRGMFNAKRNKDRCNIVKVTKNPELLQNFTNDSDKLKNQLREIVANGENGADIDKGLEKAIKQYTKKSYTDKGNQKYIVLICDGDMEYNQDIVDEAIENDIAIITILTAQESEAELKKISDETGGEFYMIDDTTEIADLLFQLQKKTLGELDTKDSDGDGLYDVYEKNGMLCANGKIVESSARTRHTDVDGISDYDEMKGDKNLDDNGKIKKKKKIRVPGTDEWIEASYFKHRSNPWEKDTDGDEYNDKEDNRPKKKDVKLIEIGRKNYVPIGDVV